MRYRDETFEADLARYLDGVNSTHNNTRHLSSSSKFHHRVVNGAHCVVKVLTREVNPNNTGWSVSKRTAEALNNFEIHDIKCYIYPVLNVVLPGGFTATYPSGFMWPWGECFLTPIYKPKGSPGYLLPEITDDYRDEWVACMKHILRVASAKAKCKLSEVRIVGETGLRELKKFVEARTVGISPREVT